MPLAEFPEPAPHKQSTNIISVATTWEEWKNIIRRPC